MNDGAQDFNDFAWGRTDEELQRVADAARRWEPPHPEPDDPGPAPDGEDGHAPEDGEPGPQPDRDGREPGDKPGGATPRPFDLLWFKDAQPSLDLPDFVEGLLIDGAFSCIFGESGSGKTFLSADLAIHVALGRSWQGRRAEKGAVVYIAAEGGRHGIVNRLAAFKQHHGITEDVPFAIVLASPNLRDSKADAECVLATVRAVEERSGLPVRLIVGDTLSRLMAGGEENSSVDMGQLVRTVDTIRASTGAHFLLVHHSGKDAARGARGHSLLRAALDTELEVTRQEGSDVTVATVRKQRDLPTDGVFAFRLNCVGLGHDRRSKQVSSCVCEPCEPPEGDGKPLPKDAKRALSILHDLIARHGFEPPQDFTGAPPMTHVLQEEAWRTAYYSARGTDSAVAKRNGFLRSKEALQAANEIVVHDPYVWIAKGRKGQ